MFTNHLPFSENLFSVFYSDYSKNHYLKSFEKKYPGKQWELTNNSIKLDLARLRMPNNKTQFSNQIDELKHKGDYWLAKYDFRVAGTKESTKDSGNRCIVFINNIEDKLEILLIYGKTDLPKNQKETAYIYSIVESEFPNYMKLF